MRRFRLGEFLRRAIIAHSSAAFPRRIINLSAAAAPSYVKWRAPWGWGQ